MKLLIFGGTTEGRQLAQELSRRSVPAVVQVATQLGAEELSDLPGITAQVGRLGAEEMAERLIEFDRCVDATHPYAQEVSRNIRMACAQAGVPLLRLLRPESPLPPESTRVDSPEEAARFLADQKGNVLLTIGSKGLPAFAALDPARLYPRVLPVEESLRACRQVGIPTQNILALHGPFSQKLNEALLEQYRIRWLVTKDGGAAGGFPEKVSAAKSVGVSLVVIGRPREQGEDMGRVLRWVLQGDTAPVEGA